MLLLLIPFSFTESLTNFEEEADDAESVDLETSAGSGRRPKLDVFDNSSSWKVAHEQKGWQPLYLTGEWRDEHFQQILSLIVLLPSGVCWDPKANRDDASVSVQAGGRELAVRVKWPEIMRSTEKVHWRFRKEAKFSKSHPRFIALCLSIGRMKNEMGGFHSTGRIRLPNPVNEKIENIFRIGSNEGARLLYIDLILKNQENYEEEEEGDFEIEGQDGGDEKA
jgi:hypothetical protein